MTVPSSFYEVSASVEAARAVIATVFDYLPVSHDPRTRAGIDMVSSLVHAASLSLDKALEELKVMPGEIEGYNRPPSSNTPARPLHAPSSRY